MKVHLFGLPKSTHIRLKDESHDWMDAVPSPHDFRSTPIPTNELGQVSAAEIDQLALAVGEGFNHLVLAGIRDWKRIASRFHFDCRVHLLRLDGSIRELEWPLLKQHLHAAVLMDEVWLRKLSPTDLKHALLLPSTVFATNHETADFWQYCDVYSKERFSAGVQILADVERHHRRSDAQGPRSWLDHSNRRFRIDLSKHALSPQDRTGAKSYRFCFEIPPGFHYDVSDDSGNAFSIEIDGRSQRVKYCNVTPSGRVRRGN